MNLHGIAAGVIGAVNPMITAIWRKSNGYTKTADFQQVPAYIDAPGTRVQMQGLSAKELQHLNSLNIQGVMRAIHVNGEVQGVARERGQGGDLFVIGAETWLVVQVLETWPDWSRVAVCLQ